MIRIFMRGARILRILAMGACVAAPMRSEAPLEIVLANHDYPPLLGEKLPHGGILARVVREVYARAGVQATMVWVPNKRAISGVMEGLYDGSFGWAHSQERDARLHYSKTAIYSFRMVFFQRAGEKRAWKTLEDLSSCRIGITLGNHYSDDFSRLQASGRLVVDAAPSDAQNMLKLHSGRIDLFPMEQEAGQMLADKLFPVGDRNRIIPQSSAIWEVPTFAVIRKSHPAARDLLARFDRSYRELAASGRLKALIEETKQQIREQGCVP